MRSLGIVPALEYTSGIAAYSGCRGSWKSRNGM
jgi:hypothetical protein